MNALKIEMFGFLCRIISSFEMFKECPRSTR